MTKLKYKFNKKDNRKVTIFFVIFIFFFVLIGLCGVFVFNEPEDRASFFGFTIVSVLGTALMLLALRRLNIYNRKRKKGEDALTVDYSGIVDNTSIYGAKLIKWMDVTKIIVVCHFNLNSPRSPAIIVEFTNMDEIIDRWGELKEGLLMFIQVHVSNPDSYIRSVQGKSKKHMSSTFKRCGTPFEIACGVIDADKKELAIAVFKAFAEYKEKY